MEAGFSFGDHEAGPEGDLAGHGLVPFFAAAFVGGEGVEGGVEVG